MITVRHLERLWQARSFPRIVEMLLSLRPEFSLRLQSELNSPSAAAALAVLRLEELGQSYVPLCQKLIRSILASQQSDGGWTDPIATAICLRALLSGQGNGIAIDRGLSYLAALQRAEGIWPAGPLRRLPADAFTSAFLLLSLGESNRFHEMANSSRALAWFEQHESELDPDASKLWALGRRRIQMQRIGPWNQQTIWS